MFPRPLSPVSCLCSLAALFFLSLPVAWADEAPLTLAECFALALKRSETVAIQHELIRETEGRFLQALSTALPRVSFEASKKRQDGTGATAFTLRDVPERKFVFSQPLFSGFKEFAAMAGSRAERRQRLHEETRAQHLLFVDVAEAVHFFVERQEDLAVLEAIRATLAERIEALTERERLGRSRASEVASAEAQLRRVEAELEEARGAVITARELLEFLTGLPRVEAVVEPNPFPPLIADEAAYLAKADQRPDVRAAEAAWQVAKKEVTVAASDFWPDVNVEGNSYTRRVGVAAAVDWDVLLTVDVPIFRGGQTLGAVRQARSRARQAKLQRERAERAAWLEIRQAYAELQAAMARATALQQAQDAAEENYRLQAEDYLRNMVSNLDVLQALEALQDTRRDVIRARHEVARLYWRLRVASGETLL